MVLALNFLQELAEPLMDLVLNGNVRLLRSSAFGFGYTDYYELDGCEFTIESIDERLHQILVTKGRLDKEALTFAVLKGKIHAS